MIYIAHRGNFKRKDKEKENTIEQINHCLSIGLHVEIDIWYIDKKWRLGHDEPLEEVSVDFLINNRLWCHAKNHEALFNMIKNQNIHCFWHDTDKYTITSKNYIWAYPGSQLDPNTICVLPELFNYKKEDILSCAGICSDKIMDYIV